MNFETFLRALARNIVPFFSTTFSAESLVTTTENELSALGIAPLLPSRDEGGGRGTYEKLKTGQTFYRERKTLS
jgi:hypothetical protein